MKKITSSLLMLIAVTLSAQNEPNPILTGAPFLRISPDARSSGLGDQGVATSADTNSQYWNAAKYAFSKDYSSISATYTPYLSSLTSDVYLLNATYFTFLGTEERSTLAASINYFNLGNIDLNGLNAATGEIINLGMAKPNEFSIDLSYGLRLSNNYSMAVTGRYIRSDMYNGTNEANLQPGSSFAVDVAGFYETEPMDTDHFEGKLRAGFQISNIGPKLDYSKSEDISNYLPTNLRLGVGYDFKFDDYNKLAVSTQFSKLLVPTPKYIYDADGQVIGREIPNKGPIDGIFSSFGDAPGGFSEEMKEISYSLGAEYSYNEALFIRTGYFHESRLKGDRQHITFGAGLRYNSFGIDLSYLVPTSKTNNALENTMRFGISWNFGGETRNAY